MQSSTRTARQAGIGQAGGSIWHGWAGRSTARRAGAGPGGVPLNLAALPRDLLNRAGRATRWGHGGAFVLVNGLSLRALSLALPRARQTSRSRPSRDLRRERRDASLRGAARRRRHRGGAMTIEDPNASLDNVAVISSGSWQNDVTAAGFSVHLRCFVKCTEICQSEGRPGRGNHSRRGLGRCYGPVLPTFAPSSRSPESATLPGTEIRSAGHRVHQNKVTVSVIRVCNYLQGFIAHVQNLDPY